ncbi:MAG: spermidine/putrescine ABC transporter substrate-binding protein, partial [Clostridia bacterium]|nr:spermidine/putrescine ABC transporter substrate-binding protein [Clostridia bacterium]
MKKTICILMVLVLTLGTALTFSGCGKSYDSEINVFNWGENISDGTDDSMDVIKEFEEKYNIKVNYTTYETNEELYSILSSSNS